MPAARPSRQYKGFKDDVGPEQSSHGATALYDEWINDSDVVEEAEAARSARQPATGSAPARKRGAVMRESSDYTHFFGVGRLSPYAIRSWLPRLE